MIKEKQNTFYAALGNLLTAARKSRSMTVTQLATRSGEQFNTIQSIESGNLCSAHHFVWMNELFGIDYKAVRDHMEGKRGEEIEIKFNNGSIFRVSNKPSEETQLTGVHRGENSGINWEHCQDYI